MPERSRQQRAYYVERTMRALEALAVEPLSAEDVPFVVELRDGGPGVMVRR